MQPVYLPKSFPYIYCSDYVETTSSSLLASTQKTAAPQRCSGAQHGREGLPAVGGWGRLPLSSVVLCFILPRWETAALYPLQLEARLR
jgi:hypothetical protein